MKVERTPSEARRRFPELVLTLLVVAGLVHTAIRFHYDGKLPQPYIYDTADTFMDWFNTAYWAHNPGAFDNWRTVYPPLGFVFLKFFGIPSCYGASGLVARDCDWIGVTAILGWYALGSAVAALAFRRADPRTAPFRSFTFAFGLPWLFTLERGNLILPCFVFFAIAYGGLARSPWMRAAATAITINFKPYLLLSALAWAVNREWRQLELAGIATVLLYLLTYAILGDGDPLQLIANTQNWVQFTSGFLYEFIYYSTSYAPMLGLDTPRFPTRDFVPSALVDALVFWIPIVIRSSQVLLLFVLAGAWLQPRALPTRRVALLMLTCYLVGQSPGGYTESFLIFLLFLERWERVGPIVAIVSGYLLSVSYDLVLANFVTLDNTSWLAGRPVSASFGMAMGMFVRPGLVVIMFWALALDSLAMVARAHCDRRPTLAIAPAVEATG